MRPDRHEPAADQRSLQIPLDTLTPAATLTARLDALQELGGSLPVHFSHGD